MASTIQVKEHSSGETSAVLDKVVKYAVLFIALAYACGFMSWGASVGEMGKYVGTFQLFGFDFGPLLLTNGLLIIALFCITPMLIVSIDLIRRIGAALFKEKDIPVPLRLDDRRYVLIAYRAMILCGTPCLAYYWALTTSGPRGGIFAAFGGTLLVFWLLYASEFPSLTTGRAQVLLCLVILMSLVSFSTAEGRWGWQSRGKGDYTQLLVSPDSVDGLKQLGIKFTSRPESAGQAQLSDKIEMIPNEGENYIIRLEGGRVLAVSKSKVWALAPSGQAGTNK